jgi:uncharacterized membrane protein YkvA (DUF1232 family)
MYDTRWGNGGRDRSRAEAATAGDFTGADGARARRDERMVAQGFWPKIKRLAASLPFAEDLLSAYYCAFDRATPMQVRMALLGALAYFVLPTDLMPDILAGIGFTDDATVLLGVMRLVYGHLTPAHRAAAREALDRIAGGREPA